MPDFVAFHFLLLGIGEVLKTDRIVTAQKLQDFIASEDAFGGIRVPLENCRLALRLMRDSGFLELDENKAEYRRKFEYVTWFKK